MKGFYQHVRNLLASSSDIHKTDIHKTYIHKKTAYPPPWLSDFKHNPNLLSPGGHPIQPPKIYPKIIYSGPSDPAFNCNNDQFDDKCDKDILFELDGWSIEHFKGAPPNECDWISHYCPSYGWRYRIDQWCLMADGVCPSCCQEVPGEVMGVWKLNNFDKLPDIEQAKAVIGGLDGVLV
jgi:hypothetical protein